MRWRRRVVPQSPLQLLQTVPQWVVVLADGGTQTLAFPCLLSCGAFFFPIQPPSCDHVWLREQGGDQPARGEEARGGRGDPEGGHPSGSNSSHGWGSWGGQAEIQVPEVPPHGRTLCLPTEEAHQRAKILWLWRLSDGQAETSQQEQDATAAGPAHRRGHPHAGVSACPEDLYHPQQADLCILSHSHPLTCLVPSHFLGLGQPVMTRLLLHDNPFVCV